MAVEIAISSYSGYRIKNSKGGSRTRKMVNDHLFVDVLLTKKVRENENDRRRLRNSFPVKKNMEYVALLCYAVA